MNSLNKSLPRSAVDLRMDYGLHGILMRKNSLPKDFRFKIWNDPKNTTSRKDLEPIRDLLEKK